MRKWQLKGHHKGKRGGVTVAVPGHKAGNPLVPRVHEILYGDEVIEGDHWAEFSGVSLSLPLREVVEPQGEPEEGSQVEASEEPPEELPEEPPSGHNEDPSGGDVSAAQSIADEPAKMEIVDPLSAAKLSRMSRTELEEHAIAAGVTGPDGRGPSDAKTRAELLAWLSANPTKPNAKRRRRKR